MNAEAIALSHLFATETLLQKQKIKGKFQNKFFIVLQFKYNYQYRTLDMISSTIRHSLSSCVWYVWKFYNLSTMNINDNFR